VNPVWTPPPPPAREPGPVERTFAMAKPDAVARGLVHVVIGRIEVAGFRIVRMKMAHLTLPEAQRFYGEHEGKPFYEELCWFMASGHVVAFILESNDAIVRWREIIGYADARQAKSGTLRAIYGEREGRTPHDRIYRNLVHGSDSAASVERERAFFWPQHPEVT
jgi:nucleoside-diphosphate kinase